MSQPLIINKNIVFRATKAEVWNLVTNPALTKQYMFGCEVLSDWQVGSSVNWKGKTEDGKDIIYVQGKVTAIIPGEKVSFTMFDPNIGIPDTPINYAHLTYQIASTKKGTLLTLIQSYPAEGYQAQKRYEESLQGWDMVMNTMQELMERET